ncbi:hypothetical protein M2263_002811 [Providencia alcalifaciens]|nr:hypothetical protein [Providencia alcalifaciens]
MNKKTLKDVLLAAPSISWDLALYLPKNTSSWSLDTIAMIEDPDNVDSDDPDADPEVIKEANYRYVLSIQTLQSIVSNARLQKMSVTEKELFQCFIYFFSNDAYLTL